MLNGLAPSILGDFVHFRSTVSARFTRSSSTSDCVIPFRHSARQFRIMVFLSESYHMLEHSIRRHKDVHIYWHF